MKSIGMYPRKEERAGDEVLPEMGWMVGGKSVL